MHSVDTSMMDPSELSLTAEQVVKGRPTDDGSNSHLQDKWPDGHIWINKDAGRKGASRISALSTAELSINTFFSLLSELEGRVLQVPFRVCLI
jgi:hypothetical protein